MRKDNGKIPCPLPDCEEEFDLFLVTCRLNEMERKRYQNLIREVVCPSLPKINHLAQMLREILTLCCPSCKFAVGKSLFCVIL